WRIRTPVPDAMVPDAILALAPWDVRQGARLAAARSVAGSVGSPRFPPPVGGDQGRPRLVAATASCVASQDARPATARRGAREFRSALGPAAHRSAAYAAFATAAAPAVAE